MLTKLFVTRPRLAGVLIAVATIAGVLAALGLRVQYLPNVNLPTATLEVFYPAASTVEMRDSIVRPIEDHLAGAPELEHIQSRVQQGYATITAQFGLKSNRTNDMVEVQRRLQAAQSQLPPDLITPTVETYDPGQAPVISMSVSAHSMSPSQLSALIQNAIVPAIEQVPGVGSVQAKGLVTPAVLVEVDPKKLDAAGLSLTDIIAAITGNNIAAAGGILFNDGRETGIDIRGDVTGALSVATLPIPVPPDYRDMLLNGGSGAPAVNYRLSDIASVSDSHEPQRIFTYVNGQPNFFLTVQKATDSSEVGTASGVAAALPGIERRFPGVAFSVINNETGFTISQVTGVGRTLLEGILLVAIVMVFFLRSWRNAAAVLIAIPTSLLVTLAVMQLGHLTIDIVSLLAMTLITGILVDDSIVVLENIDRHREMGESPTRAAIDGRLEIGLAAIVITLVDVVVFLPIAFLPGMVGRFLSEFALVVVVATLSSLLISFTIAPALAANWALLSRRRGTDFARFFSAGFERLRDWYADRVLPWALRHPFVVLGGALVTFLGAIALLWPLHAVGFEFIPAQESGEIFVQLDLPGGTPLANTRAAIRSIEQRVDAIPDLRSETTVAGAAQSPVGGYLVDGAAAQIDVHLREHPSRPIAYWVAWLRRVATKLAPNGNAVVIPNTNVEGADTQPIDYLLSDTNGDPGRYAPQVYAALADTPGSADVYSSASGSAPQLNIAFDRDAARKLNISLDAAAAAIRAAFGGLQVGQFETLGGLKNVLVIYPLAYQRDVAQLQAIPVRTTTGTIVHIGDFVRFSYASSPRIIDRVDRQTVVHISANVAHGASLSNVDRAFQAHVAALHLPSSVQVVPSSSGSQQNLHDTVVGMSAALAAGLVLVFLLMVALYNSYLSPFIIMFSVPLAVVGAIGSLALTHQTLNAFSLIGTVMLIGLVSKNGILLVDFANRLKDSGNGVVDAIRESARTRFRPIVMTTVAMVCGMLPLALAFDPAVESRRSLGIVVIGGLVTSLLLTLVVVPVIYSRLVPERLKVERAQEPGRAKAAS